MTAQLATRLWTRFLDNDLHPEQDRHEREALLAALGNPAVRTDALDDAEVDGLLRCAAFEIDDDRSFVAGVIERIAFEEADEPVAPPAVAVPPPQPPGRPHEAAAAHPESTLASAPVEAPSRTPVWAAGIALGLAVAVAFLSLVFLLVLPGSRPTQPDPRGGQQSIAGSPDQPNVEAPALGGAETREPPSREPEPAPPRAAPPTAAPPSPAAVAAGNPQAPVVPPTIGRDTKPTGQPATPANPRFAQVVKEQQAEWENKPQNGLTAATYALRGGAVTLRMKDGTTVTMQGPARFRCRSGAQLELLNGQLEATVPPAAIGFRVVVAGAEVIDLGTQFRVAVDGSGTQVRVLRGSVQVNSRPTDEAAARSFRLSANDFVFVSVDGRQTQDFLLRVRVDGNPKNLVWLNGRALPLRHRADFEAARREILAALSRFQKRFIARSGPRFGDAYHGYVAVNGQGAAFTDLAGFRIAQRRVGELLKQLQRIYKTFGVFAGQIKVGNEQIQVRIGGRAGAATAPAKRLQVVRRRNTVVGRSGSAAHPPAGPLVARVAIESPRRDRLPPLRPELREVPRELSAAPATPEVKRTRLPKTHGRKGGPHELIERALLAELNGELSERAAHLSRAKTMDPHLGIARWSAGEVRSESRAGGWATVEQLEREALVDPRIQEYRLRRDAMQPTLAAHQQLAVWCRKQGLRERERHHWRQVLLADPRHGQARKCLGLKVHGGFLLTVDQIAQVKAQRAELYHRRREWLPHFNRWAKALLSQDAAAHEEARAALRGLRDPQLTPLLESFLSPRGERVALAVVNDALSQLSDQAATESLARHAVLAPWRSVRQAATAQLRKRDLHGFVPLLITAMEDPLELVSWIDASGMNGPEVGYALRRDGQHATRELRGTIGIQARPLGLPGDSEEDWRTNARRAERAEERRAREVHRELQGRVAQSNAAARRLNRPIREALVGSTGLDHGSDPQPWRAWWQQYVETVRLRPKPVHRARRYDQEFVTYQASNGRGRGRGDQRVDITRPVQALRDAWRKNQEVRDQTAARVAAAQADARTRMQCSCFPAGTPVRTQTGLQPIETIRAGDLVLSKHPETGELAYRPVLLTTVRPARSLIGLQLDGERLRATRGHPLWCNGRGWQMAKQLAPGEWLSGMRQPVRLQGLREELVAQNVFNLVVADFHTYFVGRSNLLVHDNTPFTPLPIPIPGATFRLKAEE